MQCLPFFLAAFLQFCATAGQFSLRLSGSPNLCIGRVEVFHRGKWGTVCDDEWDMLDVAVVCRELDCGEALSALHGAWFGEGTGPIWLNEVRCTGTEQRLHACRHKGFRRHVCTHEEDASAICSVQRFSPFTAFSPSPTVRGDKMEAITPARSTPPVPAEGAPALRLVGGRSRCSGRVEVFHQGQWGTVCDDMWGLTDVAVVCRELGCGEALAAPDSAIFGEGNNVIWLDDVQCQGGESVLAECPASPWGTNNCRHNEDAGAVCSDEMPLTMVEEHLATLARTLAPQRPQPITHRRSPRPTQSTRDQIESVSHDASWHIGKSSREGHSEAILAGQWQVRLAGGSGSCAGRVEVLHKDSWGTVCDDGWDLLDATVVCRELGCGAPLLSPGNARYGPGPGPIWLDDVNCTGKESTLQHCRSQPWGQHNCNHHEDASVICTGRWKPLSLLEPATDSHVTELIPTTQAPSLADESGLQTILDTAEGPTQGLPPAWEMEFPGTWHPDELFLPPTHEVELEVEKEEPVSPWNIQETIPGEEVLQDVHDIKSTSPSKTRSLAHTGGLEPTDFSVKSQPLPPMWDLERETEPPSLLETVKLKHGLKAALETEPSIQWDNMSREPPVTHKAEPSSSSTETHPASAIWVVESERETEPNSFSGIELLPVTQDLKDTMEAVTQAQWDDISTVPPVTQEPTNPSTETEPPSPSETATLRQSLKAAVGTVPSIQRDVSREPPVTHKTEPSSSSTETEPASAVWDVESERGIEPTNFSGTELLPVTQDLKDTMEVVTHVQWDDLPVMPSVTQEPINPSTETPLASTMWVWESERETESVIHGGMELFPSSESLEATREMEMPAATQNIQPMNNWEEISPETPDSKEEADPKQKERGDKNPPTVKSIDTVSRTSQTKAPSTSKPSAEPVMATAEPKETSPGCSVRMEMKKDGQDCCCSSDTLGNVVHAMDGLHGELGSLSTVIQQQGSQLESVARSLAQLATSLHQLVGVLPALMQPVPAPPSSAPCRQDEGEIQNQLPLK